MKKLIFMLLAFLSAIASAKDVNILDFGANPNGKALTTEMIQKAIDQCAETGGGTVNVPPGTYLTTSLFLRSNVNLHIHKGATLLGSTDPRAFRGGVVNIHDIQNASVTGLGKIDGQGSQDFYPPDGPRHNNLFLSRSKNITVKDITLVNSSSWVFRIRDCDGVIVQGVKIYSFTNVNNDGIDIDGKNIIISGCIVDCEDDAICLKSDNPKLPTENISITNCIVASNCNGIKFGTSSYAGFRNVTVSNCVIRRPSETNFRHWSSIKGVSSDTTVISGLALEIVDGGMMNQVSISNISMTGIQTPLFIRLGNRKGRGFLKNVVISNITATNESLITSSVTGVPESYVEDVIIKDVIFTCKGTGTSDEANMPVPEKEEAYPENRMFGYSLPAYGLYVRHLNGLVFENFRFRLLAPDTRPAIVMDDCHNIRIDNFDTDLPREGRPVLRLINSSNVILSGYHPKTKVPLLMSLEGDKCTDIKLLGNDLSDVIKVVEYTGGAKPNALKELGNYNRILK